MFIRKLFIISLLSYTFHAGAQELLLLSSSDHLPVAHVAAFNLDRQKASISDSTGQIKLGIFTAQDTVVFQHPAYISAQYPWKELMSMSVLYLKRKKILIDEFVISASKYRESKLIIPYMVGILEQEDLQRSTARSAAEILEETGNILVQRSQGGGGSPILRGFEANKVLLVIDGVRMNNAIYRSGHLQNSITIDQAILDRTEVIFGPTSIIYGSDALGGVIHYYTRDPETTLDSSRHFGANARLQYASAMKAGNTHLDLSAGSRHWAFLSSISYKDLGDVRMGARRNPTLGDWGKWTHIVAQDASGRDITLPNEDPLLQRKSGYSQLDLLQKIKYTPSKYVDWILNLQYSTSSDIHRLDQLNDWKGEDLKYAEYYYGPQKRFFSALKNVLKKNTAFFTNMTSILAYQAIGEDRHSRKFGEREKLKQQEDVQVFSFNLDLLKIWGSRHRLNYGADWNYNLLSSRAWYQDADTGTRSPAQTRYPEGGSQTWSASLYASYKWILQEKLVLNLGSRYNRGAMQSLFDNVLLPYERIRLDHGALSGTAGLVYKPTDFWQLNTILSTGFRNPNVDDYGKVRAKEDYVTVPNPELSPEYTYNAEFGITRLLEGYMKIQFTAFYTYLRDAIVRTAYQLNGQDSLLYDGDLYRITANYNAGRAYIYGGSLGMNARLNEHITLESHLNYTRGYNLSDEVPLGHIPPVFGRTVFSYNKGRFFLDTWLVYQGWKDLADFSPYGEDNEGEAMEHGYPAWWTANFRAGFEAGRHFSFLFSIENILDQFYKPYASGIAAPGRNFILSARIHI